MGVFIVVALLSLTLFDVTLYLRSKQANESEEILEELRFRIATHETHNELDFAVTINGQIDAVSSTLLVSRSEQGTPLLQSHTGPALGRWEPNWTEWALRWPSMRSSKRGFGFTFHRIHFLTLVYIPDQWNLKFLNDVMDWRSSRQMI